MSQRNDSLTIFGRPLSDPLNIILIANCLVFLLQQFANQQLLFQFALIPDLTLRGSFWQVFTYGFLHATEGLFPFHLLFNMYGFYMLGLYVLPVFGKTRFFIIYFGSQLGGGLLVLLSALLNDSLGESAPLLHSLLDQGGVPTIGASGAVFGLLAVFGMLNPESDIYLLFFRVKAKNAVWISLLVGYLIAIFGNGGISNTCHLGGTLTGLVFFRFFSKKANLSSFQNQWSTRIDEPVLPAPAPPAKTPSVEDLFLDQKRENEKILAHLAKLTQVKEIVSYLSDKQVPDANICPPSTYNSEDPICLRCEWLPNCAMRKIKT